MSTTFRTAIRDALDEALAEDERVILFGEDVAVAGGVFATTTGLYDKYGSERVFDTPISELALAGAGFGSAVTGLRQGDILRLRRADFTEAGLSVRTGKTGKTLEFGWSEGLRRAVLVAVGARDFIPLMLLSTQTGEPYTSDGFRTLWHKAMKAARATRPAMPRWTFHDLRAKAGSESRDWRLLGHMDQRTFERVYNRLPRRVSPTR